MSCISQLCSQAACKNIPTGPEQPRGSERKSFGIFLLSLQSLNKELFLILSFHLSLDFYNEVDRNSFGEKKRRNRTERRFAATLL